MKQKTRSEEQTFLSLMKTFGVPVKRFDEAIFLNAAALKAKATHSYSLRDGVDFYFNAKGRLVGTATNYRDSWIKRRFK